MSMKFEDMKLDKISNTVDTLMKMKTNDMTFGSKICGLFDHLTTVGKKAVLCTLVESLAEEKGIAPPELLNEIRQTIKEVRGNE